MLLPMRHAPRIRRPVARFALASCCALAGCALTSAAAVAARGADAASSSTPASGGAGQASVSTNWAGYVATRAGGAGFTSVSGSWREPSATCGRGHETDSAVWVGLGGYSEASRGLEQIGTDDDCTRAGAAVYKSWFELLPAEPVDLPLAVHPGDEIDASVTIKGDGVTLRIRDDATGAHRSLTRRSRHIDGSSAEWIVEAPSACVNEHSCQVLALTDFGQVAFASATAVARAHTGGVIDDAWSATALELQQRGLASVGASAGARVLPTHTLTEATPSAIASPDGAFSVLWRQLTAQPERPGPAAQPGFGGGTP